MLSLSFLSSSEMVLGLTDGQSLTTFIARPPMICSPVIFRTERWLSFLLFCKTSHILLQQWKTFWVCDFTFSPFFTFSLVEHRPSPLHLRFRPSLVQLSSKENPSMKKMGPSCLVVGPQVKIGKHQNVFPLQKL